jgi:hypothetical protein
VSAGSSLLVAIVLPAIVNAILIVMRRIALTTDFTGPDADAKDSRPSRKRAWHFLILGLYLFGTSLFQIVYPRLPSDRPLGAIILIGSPVFPVIAWLEFKKRPS